MIPGGMQTTASLPADQHEALLLRLPPDLDLDALARGPGGLSLSGTAAWAAAEFMILATTLAAEAGPGEDILAVYRLRRQIETAFRRLKSRLHLDRLPTRTEPASRSRLYAHLVLALLCDDPSQEVLASSP